MDLNQAFSALKHNNQITVGAAWFQGRSLFGGVTAALMLAKLQHILEQPRRLRSLSVSFVAPIDAAAPITVEAQVLRQGKSVLQGEVHIRQNGAVAAVMLVVTADMPVRSVRRTAATATATVVTLVQ